MSDIPKLDPELLSQITQRTLGHYDNRAEAFWEGTRDHDVSQNRNALLRHLQGEGDGLRILDLGCGPGRDLAVFKAAGHRPTGLDGSAEFCRMARAHAGCEVLHQDMLALDLPTGEFHGVFANASLFHVPTQELPRVVKNLWTTLRPGGVLLSSNPRGDNREGWSGERYGAYHDLDRFRALVLPCGFEELEHYYRPPGLPREQQPWLVTVFRRIELESDIGTLCV